MKSWTIRIISLFLTLVIIGAAISSCDSFGGKVQLVERAGLWYKKGSDIPFSGTYIESGLELKTRLEAEKSKYIGKIAKIEKRYLNGKRHGDFCAFYRNAQVAGEGSYLNGKLHGEYQERGENTSITADYVYDQGEIVRIREWWPNSIYCKRELHYKAGKMNGECKTWYPMGELESEVEMNDGKLHGLAKYYHKWGQLADMKQYFNGTIIRTFSRYELDMYQL